MIEVHCINQKTRETARCLVAIDSIERIVEIPDDKSTVIVFKQRRKFFFWCKPNWMEILEPFDKIALDIEILVKTPAKRQA